MQKVENREEEDETQSCFGAPINESSPDVINSLRLLHSLSSVFLEREISGAAKRERRRREFKSFSSLRFSL